MQVVVLAAGRGTRMGELTEEVPKPLLTARGKSLLHHRLDILPEEITEIVLVIGYKGEEVQKTFGEEYNGRPITYVWQHTLSGTAGALIVAKDVLGEKFLVLLGDDLYDKEPLQKAVSYDWAMTGVKMKNNGKIPHLHTDEQGYLTHLAPVPQSSKDEVVTDAGIHLIGKEFFEYEPVWVEGKEGKEWGIPQTLSVIARDIPIKVNIVTNWTRISAPEDLKSE